MKKIQYISPHTLITLLLSIAFVFFGIRISMHISYILLLLALLYYAFFSKAILKVQKLDKQTIILLSSFVFYALSSLPPLAINHGWEGSWRFQDAYMKFLIYALIFFLITRLDIKIRENLLLYSMFIGGSITSILAIIAQVFFHQDHTSLLNGVFQFAYFCGVITIIALNVWLESHTSKRLKILSFLAALLCLLALMVNASRGVILGVAMGSFFTFLIHAKHSGIKKTLRILIPILLAVLTILLTPSLNSVLETKTKQVSTETKNFDPQKSRETSIGDRFKIWDHGLAMFKLSPWLGMNPKTRIEKKEEISAISHLKIPIKGNEHIGESHNQTINALAKAGLLGIFALYFLYFGCTQLFLNKTSIQNRGYIWVSSALSILILYITDGCFNTPLDSKIEAPLFCLSLMLCYNLYSQYQSKATLAS